jgi:hypothetical protein
MSRVSVLLLEEHSIVVREIGMYLVLERHNRCLDYDCYISFLPVATS